MSKTSKSKSSSKEKVETKKTTAKKSADTKKYHTPKTEVKKSSVESSNKETKKTEKKDSKTTKNSRLVNILGGSLAALLLILAILFVPIGAQSNFSRILDVFNAHQYAFAVDQVYRGNLSFSPEELRNRSCSNNYPDYDKQIRALMLQGNQSAEIYPVDDQYRDTFNFEVAADGIINAEQKAVEGNFSSDIYVSSDISGQDEVTIKGEFNNVTTTDGTYIKVEGFQEAIQELNLDVNPEPGTYYKADFQELYKEFYPESQAQISEEIGTIVTAVDDILTFTPNELLDETLYDEASGTSCKTLEGVEFMVEEPKDISFTSPSGTTDLYVRPVVFRIDDISKLNLDTATDTQVDFFASDKPFEYAKAQYENVKTITDSLNRIIPPVESPVYDDIDFENLETDENGELIFPEPTYTEQKAFPDYTQEEYSRGIENSKEYFRDSQASPTRDTQEVLDELGEELKDVDYVLELQTYFDMRTGDITAYTVKVEFKVNDAFIQEGFQTAPDTVKNILKSGLVLTSSSWNIKNTEAIDSVEVPSDFKDGSELLDSGSSRKTEEN